MRILILDDDAGLRRTVSLLLEDEGHDVITAADGEEGLQKATESQPDLILTDVRMPGLDGIGFLDRYEAQDGAARVIVMTAYGNSDLAIEAIRKGAWDYIDKPFTPDSLLLRIRIAEESSKKDREIHRLRRQVRVEKRHGGIIASSAGMTRALELAERVARHPTTALVTGESGTGKELIARLIHEVSGRTGAFVPVNCGAIPENLLESELFGHVKGSFTGATADRTGLFEEADGGTLFLDEVGELPQSLQVKLLRALQEGEIRRVGESKPRQVDVRIVAATARDLEAEVQSGGFRSDLYYRINVVRIHLPPLRHRTDEIPQLAKHFLGSYNEAMEMAVEGFETAALKCMAAYGWPGNVRELENVVERAMVLADGETIEVEDLPEIVRDPDSTMRISSENLSSDELSVKKRTAELERHLIARALEVTEGNRTRAAELLELSYRALLYKIRDYGLG
ncbi:MAG: sigma-54 dependent transcriptional regulator [Gemmatimonadota bacterium]|jgi:two-component system response regulator AtoC